MPAVSVIIPTYNCAELLPAAIDSVLAQSFRDFEILIIDDGSRDNTREVLARYLKQANVHYYYQENRGLPAARNAGARLSRSEYLAFVDADDTLPPKSLEVMKREVESSGAAWCLIDVLRIKDGITEVRHTPPPREGFEQVILSYGIWRSIFYRRDAFVSIGMYDEEMRYLEDWDLYARLIESNTPYVYIPQPLYCYVWREGSIITKKKQIMHYMEKVSTKHAKRLADAGDRRAAKVHAANMWGLARRYLYEMRDLSNALRCARESLAYDLSVKRIVHPLFHAMTRLLSRPDLHAISD